MAGTQTVCEVLKFASPWEVLKDCAVVSNAWHRVSDSDNLWITLMEDRGLSRSSASSPKQWFHDAVLSSTLIPVIKDQRISLFQAKAGG